MAHKVHLPEKTVINMIQQANYIIIGQAGLLLVVSTYLQFQVYVWALGLPQNE